MSPDASTAAPSVSVRSARPDEYRQVGQLTHDGFATGPYGASMDLARIAFERDAAGRAATGDLLVAVDDASGTLLGTASLLRARTTYARVARDGEAEVRLLTTSLAARGRGVGAALMVAAIERARAWDVDAVVLDTGADNLVAQRQYHRLGFERVPDRETTHVPGVGILVVFRYDLRATDGVLVRLVRPEELDAVAALSVAAYSQAYDLPADYLARTADVEPRARAHEVWVAQDRATGDLLGTVTTPRPGEHVSPLGREGELDIRSLAVDPAVTGRGIGTLLTTHAIALARLRGLDRVVLNSGPDMFAAHRLYERLGFTRLPDRETHLPDGRPIHAYALDLPPSTPPTTPAK